MLSFVLGAVFSALQNSILYTKTPMYSIKLQIKSPATCSACRISSVSCSIPLGFFFLHNHKVLQRHLIVEDGVIRVSSQLSPPLGQNTASVSYGLDRVESVDCQFRFYINRATDWCYIACNSCQKILRNSICLLRHTFAIGNHREHGRDHFQPPLVV